MARKKKEGFSPTPAMMMFADAVMNPDAPIALSKIAEFCGLDTNIFWKWKKKHGDDFLQWFNDTAYKNIKKNRNYLWAIGLKKAVYNFDYWKEMTKHFCGLTEKLEKALNITGSVNIGEGLDDDAIRRILQAEFTAGTEADGTKEC